MIATAKFVIEPLRKHHDRAAFSCGVESLDRYLKKQAGQEDRRNIARIFVLTDNERRIAIGYYSLGATGIDLGDLPEEQASKLPRYPVIPGALIGRLAVDARYHGCGYGEVLLVDALKRIIKSGAEVASHAVIVDAISDSAAAFYEKYGFQKFPAISNRLFLPIATAKQLFND